VDGYFANVYSQKSTTKSEKYIAIDATTVLYTANVRWAVKLKKDTTVILNPLGMQFLLKKTDNHWKLLIWTEQTK